MNTARIKVGLVLMAALIVYFPQKQRKVERQKIESLSIDELREKNEIVARINDPCHPRQSGDCPRRKFIAVVPKIKGIGACLVITRDGEQDPPQAVDRFVCQNTEFLDANILASHLLELAPPADSGSFHATLIVRKDDKIHEINVPEPIEVRQDARTN